MNIKKVILILLIIGVVSGLAYFIYRNNPFTGVEKVEEIVEVPEKIEEDKIDTIAEFNKAIFFKLNDQVIFNDGLMMKLKKIEDSRCPKDVQCIWAGELAGVFELFGGEILLSKEVRLGTANNRSVSLEGYTFSLQDVTENGFNIIVQYEKPTVSNNTCYVGGCSSQICSDQKGAISTCEYVEKYACYKTAKCERQKNGKCGWTESAILKTCLSK